jgi:hypothetical protein
MLFVFLLSFVQLLSASVVTRIADKVNFQVKTTKNNGRVWNTVVTVESTAPIFPDLNSGHFRLEIKAHSNHTFYNGTSDCINIKSKAFESLSSISMSKFGQFVSHGTVLEFIDYNYEVPLKDLFTITTKVAFGESNTSHTIFRISLVATDRTIAYMNASLSQTGCSTPLTLGKWNDPWRWDKLSVPTASDAVVLSGSTEIISVENNVTVKSLVMKGGQLIAHKTSCPDGWSVDPRGLLG